MLYVHKPAFLLCNGCAMQTSIITTQQNAYLNSSLHSMPVWYVHCFFQLLHSGHFCVGICAMLSLFFISNTQCKLLRVKWSFRVGMKFVLKI